MKNFIEKEARMLDKIDRNILAALENNSRMSNADLARTVHISRPSVIKRINRFLEEGVIEKFSAVFSLKKIGSHGYGVKSSNGKVVSLKSFDMQRDIFDANELQGGGSSTSFNHNRNDFSVAPDGFDSSVSEPEWFHESVSHTRFSIDEVNPANGLPMIGNVDVSGNPYGIDRHD